eukprot:1855144-Pleurochrysis_carterae.AAC.1
MDSSALRTDYPQTCRMLNKQREKHPSLDASDDRKVLSKAALDYTQWAMLGRPSSDGTASPKEKFAQQTLTRLRPGEVWPQLMPNDAAANTERLVHKSISTRRSTGGKLFTSGGAGHTGCDHQVA